MNDIRKQVFDILEDICEYDGIKENPDMELLESNILDSLSFILLLEQLEDEFDIEIQPTQIDLSVLKTANSIADFVEKALDE